MWNELKYRIADFLFEGELDDAYDMGIREGWHRRKLSLYAELKILKNNSTKAQAVGLDAAIKWLEEH